MSTATKQTKAQPIKQAEEVTQVQPTGKVHIVAKNDLPDMSKMTLSERLAFVKNLEAEIIAAGKKEFEEAVNSIVAVAKSLGRNNLDIINTFHLLLSDEEKKEFAAQFKGPRAVSAALKAARAPRGSKPPKETQDVDSKGARPVAGTKYKLPDGSLTWNFSGAGARKVQFIEAIKAGATWESMAVPA